MDLKKKRESFMVGIDVCTLVALAAKHESLSPLLGKSSKKLKCKKLISVPWWEKFCKAKPRRKNLLAQRASYQRKRLRTPTDHERTEDQRLPLSNDLPGLQPVVVLHPMSSVLKEHTVQDMKSPTAVTKQVKYPLPPPADKDVMVRLLIGGVLVRIDLETASQLWNLHPKVVLQRQKRVMNFASQTD